MYMSSLDVMLSFETVSGFLAGLIASATVLAGAFIIGARTFSRRSAFWVFIVGLVLRQALCVLAALGVFNPVVGDIVTFQIKAAQAVGSGDFPRPVIAGVDNFVIIQAALQTPFGISVMQCYALGLLGFAALVLVLVRFIRSLGLSAYEFRIVAAMTFVPGSLLYLNYNTREVFQVLFLVAMVWLCVEFRRSPRPLYLVLAVVAGYLFASTHNRYLISVPFLMGALLFTPRVGARRRRLSARVATVLLGGIIVAGLLVLVGEFGFADRVASEGVQEVARDIAERGSELNARTQFPILLNSADRLDFVWKLPLVFGQFVLAPIVPPMITAPIDFVPALDTVIRCLFLLGSFRLLVDREASAGHRDLALVLICGFAAFCLMSLLGTLNAGTAQRHLMKIEWVLFIAGCQRLRSARRITASSQPRYA